MRYEVGCHNSRYIRGTFRVSSLELAIKLMDALSKIADGEVIICDMDRDSCVIASSNDRDKIVASRTGDELTPDEILDAWIESCREDLGG